MGLPAPVPSNGGWIVVQRDPPLVILLDASLQVVRQLLLPVATEQHVWTEVACSGDGRYLAISARTRIEIFDSDGASLHRIVHAPVAYGNDCCFDAEDKLWCVQPREKLDACDHLIVIDPESGEVLAEQVIRDQNGNPAELGHYSLYLCPNGVDMLLNLACGQDGSYLFLANRTRESLEVNAYPFDDRTFSGGFSPNGQEFVTGAHQGESLKIHAFPSGQVLASLDSELLFEDDGETNIEEGEEDEEEGEEEGEETDHVGYQALYLDDAHLLVETGFGRLLRLGRRSMRAKGIVTLPGFHLQGYDKQGKATYGPNKPFSDETGLSSIHLAGPDRLLTVYNERYFRLLDLSQVNEHQLALFDHP